MVKFLTMALGGLTALAVAGLATPHGQALLGIHQTQPTVPVSVIADPGAANTAAPVKAAPASHPVYGPAVRSAPAARPSAHPAPAATPGGILVGGAGAIANILLNLPHVLPRAGAPFPQGPPGQRDQRGRYKHGDQGDGGDFEHR